VEPGAEFLTTEGHKRTLVDRATFRFLIADLRFTICFTAENTEITKNCFLHVVFVLFAAKRLASFLRPLRLLL
jgi:hypothetical protein